MEGDIRDLTEKLTQVAVLPPDSTKCDITRVNVLKLEKVKVTLVTMFFVFPIFIHGELATSIEPRTSHHSQAAEPIEGRAANFIVSTDASHGSWIIMHKFESRDNNMSDSKLMKGYRQVTNKIQQLKSLPIEKSKELELLLSSEEVI